MHNEFHSIVSNARFDTALGGHFAQLRADLALVAFYNFRAAMSDHGSRDSLLRAPSQLRADGRMSDETLSAPANE